MIFTLAAAGKSSVALWDEIITKKSLISKRYYRL
ncbi:hypothetical protein HNR31_002353 [Anoxybacillus caldiproteolyticus]|uniref:Uncharacterized protein n=1 Tax=Thermaerobacillus caldiproteolyticus TaxID=247480 RepID=A0A7V9Z7V3_9BACL|nr:hypothetical protein [Anoxybacillus caldiproteolyticus]